MNAPYRDKFIVPPGIYLASHSVGAMTQRGHDYLTSKFINPWNDKGGEGWADWLTLIDEFCGALGGLLGGEAKDFCPQTNLSSGLTKYLAAVPTPISRNVILMHEHAFPSMGFAAQAMSACGYKLRFIPGDRPAHDPDVWRDALTSDVACALITHVHSNTGILSPVTDIAAICRVKGVHSIVDVAQSAGIIPIDLFQWQADVVLGSCVKWLCGGPGAGFMWIHPDHIDVLEPMDVGWFSHENPFEFDIRDFRYAGNAKKFWGGTPSIAPYAAALGGIETIAEIGVKNIRARNITLMKYVRPQLDEAVNGGTLCTPITDAQDAALRASGCQFDRRGDAARLSFHIYNSTEDARCVADILN